MRTAAGSLNQSSYNDLIASYGSLSVRWAAASRYGVNGFSYTSMIGRRGIIRFSDHPLCLTVSLLHSIL